MTAKLFYHQKSCRLCKNTNLSRALELEPTPAGNNFLTEKEKIENNEPIFPLELFFCNDCFHIQLGHIVQPKHLFKNYHFVSGTSQVNVNHFHNYAEDIISKFNLKKDSFIIDIGSNDGTCLEAFKQRGMRVLGVDPADNIAEIAIANGIPTIPDFFTKELASSIQKEYGTPDLITSHNVLAHVEDFSGVMEAIASLMGKDSIFVFEVGYFKDVFENLWFDTIYHEHLDYHTVLPLKNYFKTIGLDLFNVERVNIQGGSIRNCVQLEASGRFSASSSVQEAIDAEKLKGLHNFSDLLIFQSKINEARIELNKIVSKIKSQGKSIAGYGAPTKSTTLMNYFGLNSDIIDYIVDDNHLKQGKYSPLLHIPIVSKDYLLIEPKPDYLLILAWNFAESIIKKVEHDAIFEGEYIIPLPTPRIIQV